ncbi:InlB B-repeat-containing protein [bacterium]|nr:InlB B-repeat-containing protein [bacterium]
MELEDPTRDGFIFQGWYTDSEYMTKVNNTSGFTDDVVLYAKWKSNNCMFNGTPVNH